MLVIGTLGRARSGKSTVGASLLKVASGVYGMKARQYEFGKTVLEYCISSGRLPSKSREDLTQTELYTLVYVGNQRRTMDEDFWVDRIAEQILDDKPDVAVISGIRFPNEVRLVERSNGALIRVISLNPDGSEFISPDRNPNDVTETSLLKEDVDYVLTAYRGQPELLAGYATAIFEEIRRKAHE